MLVLFTFPAGGEALVDRLTVVRHLPQAHSNRRGDALVRIASDLAVAHGERPTWLRNTALFPGTG